MLKRVWQLLSDTEQRSLLRLVPLVIIAAMFELIGVSAVIPFVTLLADPDAVFALPFVGRWLVASAIEDPATLLRLAGVGLALAVLATNAMVLLTRLWQFRFAAADNAPSAFKARAISLVLAGGVVTAILGPQIVIFTRELLAPVMFAGSFVAVVGLAAVGAAILAFLPSRRGGGAVGGLDGLPARPLAEVVRQPRFFVGLLCAVGTYALMSFVMTGAPLAMVGCGFTPDEAALGISWHVLAMFAPSFVTGRLIGRFGKALPSGATRSTGYMRNRCVCN